jgi:hypothetical protein
VSEREKDGRAGVKALWTQANPKDEDEGGGWGWGQSITNSLSGVLNFLKKSLIYITKTSVH